MRPSNIYYDSELMRYEVRRCDLRYDQSEVRLLKPSMDREIRSKSNAKVRFNEMLVIDESTVFTKAV